MRLGWRTLTVDSLKLTELAYTRSPLIYSVSFLNLGALGLWRGKAHQSIPVAMGPNLPELPISDEAQNNARIASIDVKLH